MRHGFYLFIDEAGDEGLERLRPITADGSSEYFVMCGVLVRTTRYQKLVQQFNAIKPIIGLRDDEQIHFRDLNASQKLSVITALADLKFGLIAIVSNKRNMIKYRNARCEAKNYEIARGRVRPLRYNWFYNNIFRYTLERASVECKRWTYRAYGEIKPLQVIFSRRKEFSYSQTRAYLYKIKTSRHDQYYFNNKRQIDWSVVNIIDIDSKKHKDETGLQIADCAASSIYRSLDESWFGEVNPIYIELLSKRFIRDGHSPWEYGFKLLPDDFRAPISDAQRRSLRAGGFRL